MSLMEAVPSLGKVCRVLSQHKFVIGGFFATAMVVTLVVALSSPKSYRSQAQLLVRMGRENTTVDPTATPGQVPATALPSSLENEINSEVVLLKSPILAEKVVDALGPKVILGTAPFSPSGGAEERGTSTSEPAAMTQERYRAVATLKNSLQVEAIKKSYIIQISYEGPSPEVSQAVVDEIIRFHIDRRFSLTRAPKAQQFFAELTAQRESELKESEAKLRDLKSETGLAVPEAQRLIAVQRLGNLEDELRKEAGNKAATEMEVRVLRDIAGRSAKTQTTSARTRGVPTPGGDTMQGQLYALQIKEQDLLTRFTPEHPEVRMLHDQIEKAKAILAESESTQEQVTVGPSKVADEANLALLKLEPALAGTQVRMDRLQNQIDEEKKKLKTLNEDSLRILRLQREFELKEADYRGFRKSLEQTQIEQDLQLAHISNLSVAQPATHDLLPARSRRLAILITGFIIAVLGSFGLTLVLDRWAEDTDGLVKKMGLAVLAMKPRRDREVLTNPALTGRP